VTLDVDQYLAGCLLTANEGEISICEMAANRAKRADVKKLAQEMADEHRPLSRQLQPLAGTESTTQGSEISAGDNVPGSDAAVRTDKMTDVVPQRPVGPERNPSLGSKPGDASATQNVARDASPRISQSVNQLADADRRIHQAVTKRIRSELEQQPEAQFDAAFLNCHAVAQIEMIGVAEVIQQQSPGRLAQIAQQASAVAEGDLKQVQQLLSRHPGATTDQSAKSPEK
jgi:predicted outer membrane protein